MIKRNRLDRSFGPVGATSGLIILVAGIIVIVAFSSISGIILILLGAFTGFSSTSTQVDFQNKRLKFSNDIFGLIPVGRWVKIEPTMKLGIKEANNTWRVFSRGNLPLDITRRDFRLTLFDEKNNEIMEIMKSDSYDLAEAELEILLGELEIGRFE